MPCISVPKPALPTLPSPLSLAFTPPSVGTPAIGLCCNLSILPAFKIAPVLPSVVLSSPVIALLRGKLKEIQAFLDSIPLDCPKD